MKIRNGFVSNSSSSCFLISYDPKVIKLEEWAGHKNNYWIDGVGIVNVAKEFQPDPNNFDFDFEDDQKEYKCMFTEFYAVMALMADEIHASREVALITLSDDNMEIYNKLRDSKDVKIVKDLGIK